MSAVPKLARAAFLMVALAGLSASALSVSHAQTKDKDAAKKTAKKGRIEIREGKDEKFRYFVYNGDGKTLAMSTVGYKSAKDAEKAVEEMKDVVAGVSKVTMGEKKEADDETPEKGKKDKKEKGQE